MGPAPSTNELEIFFFLRHLIPFIWGFLGGAVGKESTANGGDTVSITHLGGSPGGGNGNLLQYSCLKNPMDRGA